MVYVILNWSDPALSDIMVCVDESGNPLVFDNRGKAEKAAEEYQNSKIVEI